MKLLSLSRMSGIRWLEPMHPEQIKFGLETNIGSVSLCCMTFLEFSDHEDQAQNGGSRTAEGKARLFGLIFGSEK